MSATFLKRAIMTFFPNAAVYTHAAWIQILRN